MADDGGVLEGRTIIVTGTSRGIGAGIAERCLSAGANVLGVSRSPGARDDCDRYAELLADVTEPDSARKIIAAALDCFGRVDGLVNNAGVLTSADCWAQTDEELDSMLAANVDAPFALSQEVARHWRGRELPGAIVNICSIESAVGWKSPPQAGYAATKGALLGLTRAMALDLAADRIRVCAIGPGVIRTEMAPIEVDHLRARIPVGELGQPANVGDAAVFLLSEGAAYVTGEILYVDGGYLLP